MQVPNPAALFIFLMHTIKDLNESTQWKATLHNVHCRIHRWLNSSHTRYPTEPKFNWNYYITLIERDIKPELWPAIWLEDRVADWGITHDYYSSPISSEIYWHGGVTWYQKFPSIPGRNVIEVGCDFAHLYDYERGCDYTLEEVFAECVRTAQEVSDFFLAVKPQN